MWCEGKAAVLSPIPSQLVGESESSSLSQNQKQNDEELKWSRRCRVVEPMGIDGTVGNTLVDIFKFVKSFGSIFR